MRAFVAVPAIAPARTLVGWYPRGRRIEVRVALEETLDKTLVEPRWQSGPRSVPDAEVLGS